jgi:hypothetical protein
MIIIDLVKWIATALFYPVGLLIFLIFVGALRDTLSNNKSNNSTASESKKVKSGGSGDGDGDEFDSDSGDGIPRNHGEVSELEFSFGMTKTSHQKFKDDNINHNNDDDDKYNSASFDSSSAWDYHGSFENNDNDDFNNNSFGDESFGGDSFDSDNVQSGIDSQPDSPDIDKRNSWNHRKGGSGGSGNGDGNRKNSGIKSDKSSEVIAQSLTMSGNGRGLVNMFKPLPEKRKNEGMLPTMDDDPKDAHADTSGDRVGGGVFDIYADNGAMGKLQVKRISSTTDDDNFDHELEGINGPSIRELAAKHAKDEELVENMYKSQKMIQSVIKWFPYIIMCGFVIFSVVSGIVMVHLSHHPVKVNQLRDVFYVHTKRAMSNGNSSNGVNGAVKNVSNNGWYINVSGFLIDIKDILTTGRHNEGYEIIEVNSVGESGGSDGAGVGESSSSNEKKKKANAAAEILRKKNLEKLEKEKLEKLAAANAAAERDRIELERTVKEEEREKKERKEEEIKVVKSRKLSEERLEIDQTNQTNQTEKAEEIGNRTLKELSSTFSFVDLLNNMTSNFIGIFPSYNETSDFIASLGIKFSFPSLNFSYVIESFLSCVPDSITLSSAYTSIVSKIVKFAVWVGINKETVKILESTLVDDNGGWLLAVAGCVCFALVVECIFKCFNRNGFFKKILLMMENRKKKSSTKKRADGGFLLNEEENIYPTVDRNISLTNPMFHGKHAKVEEKVKDVNDVNEKINVEQIEKIDDENLIEVEGVLPPSELVEAFGMIIKHMKTPQQRKAARRFVRERMFQDEDGGEFQEDGVRILSLFEKLGNDTTNNNVSDGVVGGKTLDENSEEALEELLQFEIIPSTGHELDKYIDDNLDHWVMDTRVIDDENEIHYSPEKGIAGLPFNIPRSVGSVGHSLSSDNVSEGRFSGIGSGGSVGSGIAHRRGSSLLSIHVPDSARKSPSSSSPPAIFKMNATALRWAARTRRHSSRNMEDQTLNLNPTVQQNDININTDATGDSNNGSSIALGEGVEEQIKEHPDSSDRRKRRLSIHSSMMISPKGRFPDRYVNALTLSPFNTPTNAQNRRNSGGGDELLISGGQVKSVGSNVAHSTDMRPPPMTSSHFSLTMARKQLNMNMMNDHQRDVDGESEDGEGGRISGNDGMYDGYSSRNGNGERRRAAEREENSRDIQSNATPNVPNNTGNLGVSRLGANIFEDDDFFKDDEGGSESMLPILDMIRQQQSFDRTQISEMKRSTRGDRSVRENSRSSRDSSGGGGGGGGGNGGSSEGGRYWEEDSWQFKDLNAQRLRLKEDQRQRFEKLATEVENLAGLNGDGDEHIKNGLRNSIANIEQNVAGYEEKKISSRTTSSSGRSSRKKNKKKSAKSTKKKKKKRSTEKTLHPDYFHEFS